MKTTLSSPQINFMRLRGFFSAFSSIVIVLSLLLLFTRGIHFGIDFAGGILIEAGYPSVQSLSAIDTALQSAGVDNAGSVYFGNEHTVLIRASSEHNQGEFSTTIINALQQHDTNVSIRRVEFVGPTVGEELTESGMLATLFALLAILVYVALRFQYRFSAGAILALIHDVLITLGIFSLFQWEFDLTVLAALLAIIGYSLNDTIVIYDRIRENFIRLRKTDTIDVINHSLSQTLVRTLMTSFTTLLVLISLLLFGGEVIHNFALTLIIGVTVGTYSSIYIASNSLIALKVNRLHLLPPEATEEKDLSP